MRNPGPLTAQRSLCVVLSAIVLLMIFQLPSLCLGQQVTVHTSRTLDTLGSGGPYGPDTLGVTLRYFAEGTYDTVWSVDTAYDTTRIPLDIVLAIDLSTSMAGVDSSVDSANRARIVWAKLAALHFLDSLKPGDRVSVMGWTSVSTTVGIADTANQARYFHKWCEFTSDFGRTGSFIRDSIFIDLTQRIIDTCDGQILVVRDNIPNGSFSYTPLRISSVVTAKHLSYAGRPGATRAVIMLTDGENNDQLAQSVPVALLDSLYQTQNQRFFTIGFMEGNTAELLALANAGGGTCFNAANPRELDSIYALLARELVEQSIDTVFTTIPIRISPDTVRMPIDVILAIDLSMSMYRETDGTPRRRIAWVKIAALGFLDSLGPQDRVSVLGWTSSDYMSGRIYLSDTSNASKFYQRWCPFTSDLDSVRSFIRDSLYCDTSITYDTFAGANMTISDTVPGNTLFGNTPLQISSILAMSHLSSESRPGANRVVIMMTDGWNNDAVDSLYTRNYIDSLRRTEGLQMHTVGFVDGNTASLLSLATAGGGNFYNASNNLELQSAFASLAHQLVTVKVAARKLTIQEALNCPPLYFINGTQSSTANSTVALEKTESLTDSRGNPVLRWYFKTIPIWGIAEVYYKVVAAQGANTVIGIDSAGAEGGFWSQMVYTDDAYEVITINLPETGTEPQVSVRQKSDLRFRPNVVFRPGGVVRVHMAGQRSVAMTLYNLAGRMVYRNEARFPSAGATAQFSVAGKVPAGIYAACFTFEDRTVRYLMNILR
jgi:Mg-chelatase subunit ChlD